MKTLLPIAMLLMSLASAARAQEESTPSIVSGSLQPQSPGANATPNTPAEAMTAAKSQNTPEAPATQAEALAVAGPAQLPPPAPTDSLASPPAPEKSDAKSLDPLQRSHRILSKLLENTREMDPFGLVMDPANASVAPPFAELHTEEEPQALSVSSLKTALQALPITGIYPQKQQIVLGARTFGVGGEFGLKHQDLTIRLRFEGVHKGELYFKDMETQEVTSIPFQIRPAEFEPITRNASPKMGSGIFPMGDLYIAN